MRLLPLHNYTGALTDSSVSDLATLRYLRASLQSARIFGLDTLPSVPALNARLRAALAGGGGAIPIAMQYMPYASIRPEALQNNLLSVQNDQLYDVPGRSQSPYQPNVLFAAAPARLDAPTNSVAFVFRRNLFLSGDGRLPTSLALDFGDGNGYQATTWGQPLGTTYTSGGIKRIKVRVQFSTLVISDEQVGFSTETRESWFDFIVPEPATAARYGSNGGFDYLMPVTSSHYSAQINVRYGAGHTSLVKPLIVVEQYNIATVANGKLAHCNNSNNTVDEFLDRTEQPFTAPFNLRAVSE